MFSLMKMYLGIGAQVVAGGEEHAGLLHGVGDLRGVLGADAQRFFDEHVLARPWRRRVASSACRLVSERITTPDTPASPSDLGNGLRGLGAALAGPFSGPRRVVIPDVGDLHVLARS